jgi:hypothetical protein
MASERGRRSGRTNDTDLFRGGSSSGDYSTPEPESGLLSRERQHVYDLQRLDSEYRQEENGLILGAALVGMNVRQTGDVVDAHREIRAKEIEEARIQADRAEKEPKPTGIDAMRSYGYSEQDK